MNSQYAKQVADTIIRQLYAGGRTKVMSWGAHAWRFGITDNDNAFLLFRVRGLLYKGLVRIVLNANDTYTVELVNKNSEQKFDVIKSVDNAYFDNITDIVDGLVEYTGSNESYKKALDKAGEPYFEFFPN